MIWESIVIAILLFVITGLVYQFLPASFELIALILGIGFILYLIISIPIFLYQKKKRGKKVVEKEIIKVKKVKDELTEIKDYIKYNLYYGQKREKIEAELLKQGWSKEKVDKAFREYEKEAKPSTAPKKQDIPSPKKA